MVRSAATLRVSNHAAVRCAISERRQFDFGMFDFGIMALSFSMSLTFILTPPGMREEVFKPFLRLDDARNQDEGGTGLGLAIARDIARSHGGDITLGDSPMGGLRAAVRVPV